MMTAFDILTSSELHLPKERQTDDFEGFAEGVLNGFVSVVRDMAGEDPLAAAIKSQLPKVTHFCRNLKDVLHAYLAGNTYKAYQQFTGSLPLVLGDLKKMMTKPGGVTDLPPMYRIRVTNQQRLRPADIFHLPFEMRHEAAMRRYSVPGTPMLYLGGSVYICWEEMGRPSFDDIQISAFKVKNATVPRLLNFGYRPYWLRRFVQTGDLDQKTHQWLRALFTGKNGDEHNVSDFVASYVACWPLIALCSVKTKHYNKPFVPEYILPQMVLQWLMETEEFDGIRYFSTHVDIDLEGPHHTCNFVFPPKVYSVAGQCHLLRDKFDITEPLPWRIIEAAPLAEEQGDSYPLFDFELYPGAVRDYGATAFGEVQTRLNQMIRNNTVHG